MTLLFTRKLNTKNYPQKEDTVTGCCAISVLVTSELHIAFSLGWN